MNITWLTMPTGRRQTNNKLFISKHDWGAERGSTEKQFQLSGEHEPKPFAFHIWHPKYSVMLLPAWLTCAIF